MDDCLWALLQGRLLALVDAGLLLGLGRPGAHPVHPAAAAQGGRVGDHRRLLHGALPPSEVVAAWNSRLAEFTQYLETGVKRWFWNQYSHN